MKQYKYKIEAIKIGELSMAFHVEEYLNSMGALGWRLIKQEEKSGCYIFTWVREL